MAQPTFLTTPDPIDRAAEAATRLRHGIDCAGIIDPDSADTVSEFLRSLVGEPAPGRYVPVNDWATLLAPEPADAPAVEHRHDLTTAAGYMAAIGEVLHTPGITDAEKVARMRVVSDARRAARAQAGDGCPDWCVGGCLDVDGSRLHEQHIGTVVGADVDSVHGRMRAAVDLEAFNSGDGTVTEPPSVIVNLLPSSVPEPDLSKLDGLSAGMVRHLAAGVISGSYGGEQVRLTPEQAGQLGAALVEAARLAGAA